MCPSSWTDNRLKIGSGVLGYRADRSLTMRNAIAAAVVSTAFSFTAWAADFTDEAEVIAATPIYQTINEPTSDCWNETLYPERSERSMTRYPERSGRSYAGAAVGGIAGGLIGNQIGAGNGRVAATAAGAAIGAITGDRVDNGERWTSGSADERSYLGPFIGAIAGGLLGSQVGAGNGRAAAAAVGAVAGALVGDRLDNSRRQIQVSPEARTTQRCRRVDNYRQVVSGYTVLYRYNGREAETVLPYKPDRTIKMGIAPVDGRPATRY
jgi:uncharacterized protein YcfJ